MRKEPIYFLAGICFFFLVSFVAENYVVGKQTANVERFQNVYVYTDSKPVMDHEYLGSVRVKISVTDKYEEIRNILIKNAKKEYPELDGIIIRNTSADVIKFK
ncbi:MAG: hypothetical protein RBT49_10710 [Bacteroidales bacterium]|jgi:hypothetical protein|nr:hypothetical protein [Bacteroidales bacterium]